MNILLITYIDFGKFSSGSSVRPQKMHHALVELGYNVKVLECQQNRWSERKKRVTEIMNWIDVNSLDFCYIESPSGPIFNSIDRKLIKKLYQKKIPMSYFYRDCYSKFPELFPRKKGLVNLLEGIYLSYLQYRTDKILKFVDIVYFPTDKARSYFNYDTMKLLPPAGDNNLMVNQCSDRRTCIYVGGIVSAYSEGFQLMISAFQHLNQTKFTKLILVCRKEEFETVSLEKYDWLEVYHVTGDSLESLYERADVALYPIKSSEYVDLSIGVKFFEYIGHGMPIVQVESLSMSKIMEEDKIGIVCKFDVLEFADSIELLLSNEATLKYYQNNVKKVLLKKHLWIHRAQQLAQDLEISDNLF